MKRKESTLACMKHFFRTATYDIRFFELLSQDAWESIERFGSLQFQFVTFDIYGYLTCQHFEFCNYVDFLSFLDSQFRSFDSEITTSFNIRFYDYNARRYYSLFSVYKEVYEKLYRRFQNAML